MTAAKILTVLRFLLIAVALLATDDHAASRASCLPALPVTKRTQLTPAIGGISTKRKRRLRGKRPRYPRPARPQAGKLVPASAREPN